MDTIALDFHSMLLHYSTLHLQSISFFKEIVAMVKPHVIQHDHALRLKAKQDLRDHKGK